MHDAHDRSTTLSYATPGQSRRRRPVNAGLALAGGIFLVSLGAVVLVGGLLMYVSLRNRLSGDAEVAMMASTLIFSAVCLFAGLPLIYRAARANEP